MEYCPKCREPIGVRDTYCRNCGKKLDKQQPQDRRPKGWWEDISLKELEDIKRKLAYELRETDDFEYTPGMYSKESKVVSAEKIVCGRIDGKVHTALLLVHEDASITVKCSGNCSHCEYGDVE